MIKTVKLAGYELRRFKGPLPILGLIFLVLIPTICGALYLWSNWDPYGRMDQIPVAVVNQDVPVEVEGQSINAGARLVAELREDTIFDWQFVDEQQADAGLADGDYYMIVTIPPDFSENLVSGAGPDPERAVISLRRDDVNGYLFGLMAESVQDELESAIDRAAIGAYLDSVFANLETIKADVTTAATAATALAVGATATLTTANDLAVVIGTSVQDSAELTSGLALAKEQATQLVTGITQAQTASASLVTGLTPLESSASQVASDAESVASGNADLASSLTPAISAVTSAVPPLGVAAANVEVATANVQDLVSAAGQLTTQVAAANAEIARLAAANPGIDFSALIGPDGSMTAVGQITSDLNRESATAAQSGVSVNDAFETLNTATSDLSGSGSDLTFLATTSAQVATGATSVSEGIFTASSNASTVDGTVASLATSATDLDSGIANLQITAQRLDDGLRTAETGSTNVVTGVTDLDTGANLLAADLTAAADRIPTLAPAEQADTEQVLSSPANLEITIDNPATFYGRGLAPLFFGIAIWVLAIAVFQVLRPITGRALAGRASSLRITIAGWLPVLGIAVLGSLLLLGVVWLGLGLDPVNVGGAFGVVLLAAACFTAIAQLLRTWLGAAGSAIMLVLLMVQLVTSGGLYPVETLPAPLRALHWFTPMTYLVDGLRVVFTGGPTDNLWRDVGVLAGLTIVAVALCLVVVHRRRRFRVVDLHPALA
jgi:putative membrane protein